MSLRIKAICRPFAPAHAVAVTLALAGCSQPDGALPNPTRPSASAAAGRGNEAPKNASTEIVSLPSEPATGIEGPSELMSLDPREDGWISEHFSNLAGAQLKHLAALIEDPARLDGAAIAPLVAKGFACSPLRPDSFASNWTDGPFQVRRAATWDQSVVHHGPDGLLTALHHVLGPLRSGRNLHVKFKIIRVQQESGGVTTVQLVEISGQTYDAMFEQHATWRIDWQWDGGDSTPLVRSIAADDFQLTSLSGNGGPLFVDCTQAAFSHESKVLEGQLKVGIDRWVRRLEAYHGVNQFGYNGIAIGDANGDGLDDVYACQTGGLPNRLLIAADDGTVMDTSAEAGVDFLDNTRAALLIDLDNDGDQDLVVTLPRAIVFLRNDGRGRFHAAARVTGVTDAFSLAAADFDNDSLVDVYACVYYPPKAEVSDIPVPTPLYDANNGGRNILLKNDGNWRFRDATAEVGLNENNTRFSFAAIWEDYDNDGDQDLFVANDFGRNNLYRNDSQRFRDVTEEVGMDDGAFGMSAAAADYNRDGWVDFYKANMFSSAGNRVTHQQQFMPDATEAHKDRHRHLARGNTLFENRGGRFRDASVEAGVTMGRWSWGSIFLDFNNDGWEDLLVTNGFMTGPQLDDL